MGTSGGHCPTVASPASTGTRAMSWRTVHSETFMARISWLVDTTTGHTSFAVDDATGSGARLAFRAPDSAATGLQSKANRGAQVQALQSKS